MPAMIQVTTLLPPTGSRASVAGYDTIRQPGEVRRRTGCVPQLLSAVFATLVAIAARLYGRMGS